MLWVLTSIQRPLTAASQLDKGSLGGSSCAQDVTIFIQLGHRSQFLFCIHLWIFWALLVHIMPKSGVSLGELPFWRHSGATGARHLPRRQVETLRLSADGPLAVRLPTTGSCASECELRSVGAGSKGSSCLH